MIKISSPQTEKISLPRNTVIVIDIK